MHCEKYNKQGLGNLLSHYERKNYSTKRFSNENIDKTKTYLNYNLAPTRPEGLYKFIKDRVTKLNIIKRKTAIWCCDYCLTAPVEIQGDTEKCNAFFKSAYDFLEARYGEENVVSAYVHLDETSPHLHFCFIPVVKKQECFLDMESGELVQRTIEKVIAKECINRAELNSIHPDLQRHLDSTLEFEANITNGATKNGNKSIKELKQKKELEEQIKQAEAKLAEIRKELSALATKFANLHQNAVYYNGVLVQEETQRKKEFVQCGEHIQNLLNSYDTSFDMVINQLENRDNRIYNIDLSYKKSLEVLKVLEQTNKEAMKLEAEIKEKVKELKRVQANEFDLE